MELPISLAQCLMVLFTSYFLIDLQGNFFLLWMALWLKNLSAASAFLLAGCVATDPRSVSEIAPFYSTPQITFTGFYIRIDQIPAALRWLQHLCSLKWSLNLLLLVEFDNCQGRCSRASPPIRPFCYLFAFPRRELGVVIYFSK
jgi:hypothetical protein